MGGKVLEQKYQIGTESGKILWDISKLLKDISNFEIKSFDVKQLAESNNFFGNMEYAMKTDITIPLIVIELVKGKTKLIDGNHRLFKANKFNVNKISCYFLKKHEHKKYIIDFNDELYNKIVAEFKVVIK